jgi:hypothetical protein
LLQRQSALAGVLLHPAQIMLVHINQYFGFGGQPFRLLACAAGSVVAQAATYIMQHISCIYIDSNIMLLH